PIGTKSECPQQSGGSDLGIDLPVVLAVTYLDVISRRERAPEFRRAPATLVFDVIATHELIAIDCLRALRTRLQIHRRNVGSCPDLRATNGRQPVFGSKRSLGTLGVGRGLRLWTRPERCGGERRSDRAPQSCHDENQLS